MNVWYQDSVMNSRTQHGKSIQYIDSYCASFRIKDAESKEKVR